MFSLLWQQLEMKRDTFIYYTIYIFWCDNQCFTHLLITCLCVPLMGWPFHSNWRKRTTEQCIERCPKANTALKWAVWKLRKSLLFKIVFFFGHSFYVITVFLKRYGDQFLPFHNWKPFQQPSSQEEWHIL